MLNNICEEQQLNNPKDIQQKEKSVQQNQKDTSEPQPGPSGLSSRSKKSRSGVIMPTVESDSDLYDDEYIVKQVVDMRKKNGSTQYKIRWAQKGSKNSWLDEKDCQDCLAMCSTHG